MLFQHGRVSYLAVGGRGVDCLDGPRTSGASSARWAQRSEFFFCGGRSERNELFAVGAASCKIFSLMGAASAGSVANRYTGAAGAASSASSSLWRRWAQRAPQGFLFSFLSV